jgi:hypothetical protein
VLLALAGLSLPAGAAAIVPETQITSPTNGSYLLIEEGTKLKIKGTAGPGIASVDIRCYFGEREFEANPVEGAVPVSGGSFSVEVSATELWGHVCQLRAVRHGTFPKNLGPGSESEQAQKYAGPLVAPSDFLAEPDNFFAAATTFTGSLVFESAGTFAFESELYSTAAHEDTRIFWGELNLEGFPPIETRTALQVDGTDAYPPAAAVRVAKHLGVSPAGIPAPNITRTFDEATRQLTIQDEEPIVRCAPDAGEYPPNAESCASFAPAGVTLLRTWRTSESKLALVTETWRSTDSRAHTVDARYVNEMHSGTELVAEGGVYEFPGEGAFAPTHARETKTLPPGPGIILYKTSPVLSEAGDGVHPQGAWAYDRAPSEPITVGSRGSTEPVFNEFEMPYRWAVPAGGTSTTLRMAFAQSFSLTEARALAEGALASYHPTVSIASPATGSSIVSLSSSVTVTGTAGDQIGLSSLTVDGKAVAVGSGGAWSATLTLSPGANTITAVATDQSGLTSTASVTVNYAVPPPAAVALVGKPSGRNGKITLVLQCTGVAGQSCAVALSASTLERLSHGRARSLAARSRRVTVAAGTITLPAGQRITVPLGLNRTGRKLLAHFGKLPVTLTTMLLPAAGRGLPLPSVRLTVKPRPKPHHRR